MSVNFLCLESQTPPARHPSPPLGQRQGQDAHCHHETQARSSLDSPTHSTPATLFSLMGTFNPKAGSCLFTMSILKNTTSFGFGSLKFIYGTHLRCHLQEFTNCGKAMCPFKTGLSFLKNLRLILTLLTFAFGSPLLITIPER